MLNGPRSLLCWGGGGGLWRRGNLRVPQFHSNLLAIINSDVSYVRVTL